MHCKLEVLHVNEANINLQLFMLATTMFVIRPW